MGEEQEKEKEGKTREEDILDPMLGPNISPKKMSLSLGTSKNDVASTLATLSTHVKEKNKKTDPHVLQDQKDCQGETRETPKSY